MRRPTGFLEHGREVVARRPVAVRLRDTKDVYERPPDGLIETQANRCMDCGVPFCNAGCPLGNLISEWNGLVVDGRLADASSRLHATNNFPEFTGAICPAPCEAACVLGINDEPVTIERIELDIAERAFAAGLVVAHPPSVLTGRRVAVVGSGPAGLAAAQQLRRAGHDVTVYERAERPGGLLRYGIPAFKLGKDVVERRVALLEQEGVRFACGTEVGEPGPGAAWRRSGRPLRSLSVDEVRAAADAVVVATGSTVPRDLDVPGRDLAGVVYALELLRGAQLAAEGTLAAPWVSASGRDVVIIGGGDTGSDCLGTALRQGARSVTQLEILAQPPIERTGAAPWPTYPAILRVSSSQEEGGERRFAVRTVAMHGNTDGAVDSIAIEHVDGGAGGEAGEVEHVRADLVVLAMGFVGPERAVGDSLGTRYTASGTIEVDAKFATTAPGVFACGDAARGQSLVVWAIAEGRS
ncbi:MAG TPA: glutamate synthase subunit beta, partial [Acidimicrobiales bacterium]